MFSLSPITPDPYSFGISAFSANSPAPKVPCRPICTARSHWVPRANRVYFAYGPGANGVLQIAARDKLLHGAREPTPENLLSPEVGRSDLSSMHAHRLSIAAKAHPYAYHDKAGAVRDFVMIVGEEMRDKCVNARQTVLFVDVTDERYPVVLSTHTAPDPEGRFCEEAGQFGSHASDERMAPVFYKETAFISNCNAGVRALDVRDPYAPKEIGHYIAAVTDRTCEKASDTAPCV